MAVDHDNVEMTPNGLNPPGDHNAFAADPHRQLAAPSDYDPANLQWADFFPLHYTSQQFPLMSGYYYANNHHTWYMDPYNMQNYQWTAPGTVAPFPERMEVDESFSRSQDFPQQRVAASAHRDAQLIPAREYYDAERMEIDNSFATNRASPQPPANTPNHREIKLIPAREYYDIEGYYQELPRRKAEKQPRGTRVAESVHVPVFGPRYAYPWELPDGSTSGVTTGSASGAASTTAFGSVFAAAVTPAPAPAPGPSSGPGFHHKLGSFAAPDPRPGAAVHHGPPTGPPPNSKPATTPRPAPASRSVSAFSNPQAMSFTNPSNSHKALTESKQQLAERYRMMEQEDEEDVWEEPTMLRQIHIGNGKKLTLPVRGQRIKCKSMKLKWT